MLAMFRSMVFLAVVCGLMALFMLFAGIANYLDAPGSFLGYTFLNMLSIANLLYSGPVCI